MSKDRYEHLPLKAVEFSVKNMLHAFLQSPIGQPGFSIGKVVGANTVEIKGKARSIDDVESKKVLDYGTRVIIYRQGGEPQNPKSN